MDKLNSIATKGITPAPLMALGVLVALLGIFYFRSRYHVVDGNSKSGRLETKAKPLVIEPLVDFDWKTTEPVKYRPFKPTYYISMGLRADSPSNLITIDMDYLDRVTLRRSLISQQGSGVHACLPEGTGPVRELYTYLLQEYLPARYPSMFKLSGQHFENLVTGTSHPTTPPEDPAAALRALGETVEEDMFLLLEEEKGHRCVAFMCCFPSGFDPASKFNKLLSEIHAPVPSYDKIGPSMERFFSKLEVGKNVKRMNWTIQMHSELFNTGDEEMSPDEVDVSKVHVRHELQTLSRLPETKAILFSFKTYFYPISQLKEEGLGPQVADAIQGLTTGNAPASRAPPFAGAGNMSLPLSSEEREHYTEIIDGILATSDLATVSRKKIRQGLQSKLGGKDLDDQKDAIKRLIEERFDAISALSGAEGDVPPSSVPEPSSNKRSAANGSENGVADDHSASPEPAKKKAKRSSSIEDSDARLAAQLQAQENSLARSRTTRGGGDKTRLAKKKKTPRKKSSKKGGDEDESEVDGSGDSGVPKRKAGGGFQKPFILSPTLSELCGETQLSRPQVVKKLWEHIKANDLQDPTDKRQILCDEKMHAVFKQAKVDMFRMNKEIGSHLYPVGEE
ncbi:Upstream activation factor subunit spp27 [Cladobotryum mycophilum]|uniref:Upstream activation factor subunit spp27 n=1 Tax=Cladobotryum mycophilum TaxID=491253 RepID=A0ABR0SHX3_9HYPO